MPVYLPKDLKERLENLSDSVAISFDDDPAVAREKARQKVKDKKAARKKARGRLLDKDGRSLKQRLKDYAMGSDNYSRMGDVKRKKKKKKKKED